MGTSQYSAMLLFQYREDGDDSKYRLCEDRILVLSASGASEALKMAKARGVEAQYDYTSSTGNHWYFEFVAVTDLVELLDDPSESGWWFETQYMRAPMERRDRLQVWLNDAGEVMRPARKRYYLSRSSSVRPKRSR